MKINEKYLAVLGSTGSIGKQALDVCERNGVRVEALSANSSVKVIEEQARKFRPSYAAMSDPASAKELAFLLSDTPVKVFAGPEGILEMINRLRGDAVLNSITGGDGLLPTAEAVKCGKNIALANKETLVTAGDIVMKAVKEKKVSLMPVDSEHCAIFQCLKAGRKSEVRRIILTASGGPFFGKKRNELENVGVKETLAHPTWNMGRKITVDSATMMNKCFEMIEAKHLFCVSPSEIEVVIHRQSVVHSMVEYEDGAVIAQLGVPDMRTCIQYALTYPERLPGAAEPLDFEKAMTLTFDRPDYETFKPLGLASFVMEKGGILPAVLNGANDALVKLFLDGKIPFLTIGDAAEKIVKTTENIKAPTLEQIVKAGKEAKERVFSDLKEVF